MRDNRLAIVKAVMSHRISEGISRIILSVTMDVVGKKFYTLPFRNMNTNSLE